jgi:hypothetical protein
MALFANTDFFMLVGGVKGGGGGGSGAVGAPTTLVTRLFTVVLPSVPSNPVVFNNNT